MEPSTILRSDLLDILFENRNKQYGAYALRREYPIRMALSLLFTALVAGFVCSTLFFKNSRPTSQQLGPAVSDTFRLVEIPSDPLPPPPPPPPAPSPAAPAVSAPDPVPVATEQYVIPEIVPDHFANTTVPEMSQLENRAIGNRTVDGVLPGSVVRPLAGEEGGGGEIDEGNEAAEPEILETASIMPEFPGGKDALRRWLSRQLRPQEEQEPGKRVKVMVRFVVDASGQISALELTQSGGERYDREVIRVVKKMPAWTPGKHRGKAVAVWFQLPVIFESPAE